MKLIIVTLIVLIFSGCTSSSKQFKDYSNLSEVTDRDYIDHLASIGPVYLKSEDVHEVKLKPESIHFLEQVYERITSNNEVLLAHESKPQFHIIASKIPFLFSLPKAQFFLSNGLIERYLKSEELFVAALVPEILKSDRNIYEKRIMIPVGFYNTEKMIQIAKLRPETKYQVNEWSYFVLKRAGFDASAYLNWIQVQNRNTLDFSLYLGDAIGISKEEHLFKNFMAKQGVTGVEKKINEANSSKGFYKLLNNIVSNK